MKKIVLTLSLLGSLSLAGFSQISAGPKVGLNISKYNHRPTDEADFSKFMNFNSRPTGQLGFVVNAQLSDAISIRPELLLNAKGGVLEDKDDKSNSSHITGYLELPINIVYGISLTDKVKIDVYAGPYIAKGLGGYYRMEDGSGNLEEDGNIRFQKYPDNPSSSEDIWYLNSIDAGFNFGAGLNINGFIISGNYGLGLSNTVAKNEKYSGGYTRKDDPILQNRVITFGITYLIGY